MAGPRFKPKLIYSKALALSTTYLLPVSGGNVSRQEDASVKLYSDYEYEDPGWGLGLFPSMQRRKRIWILGASSHLRLWGRRWGGGRKQGGRSNWWCSTCWASPHLVAKSSGGPTMCQGPGAVGSKFWSHKIRTSRPLRNDVQYPHSTDKETGPEKSSDLPKSYTSVRGRI